MTVYEIITEKLVAQLQNGEIPWKKPWMVRGHEASLNAAVSRSTGKPYGFINQMLLGKAGEWMTYKQATSEGGQVRKGEKGSIILMYFPDTRKRKGEEDEGALSDDIQPRKFVARYVTVFHLSQVDGLEPKWTRGEVDEEDVSQPDVNVDDNAEAVLNDYLTREGIDFTHAGCRAYYRPDADSITLPPRADFFSMPDYYGTAYHEAIHSTGHKSRLGRLTERAAFGSGVYSKEELVAEVGAAFCLSRLGISNDEVERNTVAYCQSWIKPLQNDPQMVVQAARQAEKAMGLIFGDSLN